MVHQATEWEGSTRRTLEHGFGPHADLYKGDNWNDLLKEVVTFDSVEEFWGIYVSLRICIRTILESRCC